jgi:hypothetical protein
MGLAMEGLFLSQVTLQFTGGPNLLLKVFTKEMHTKQQHIFLSYQQEWDVLQETGEQTQTSFLETFFAPIPSTTGTGQRITYILPLKSNSPTSFLLA